MSTSNLTQLFQRWGARGLSGALLLAALFVAAVACSTGEPAATPPAHVSPQQAIVDRSAHAVEALRTAEPSGALDRALASAHGVLVFPRLVKAGLLLGGEGGNGVLVARGDDGSWSPPAFYSIGGGSVGLQIGYQEASVVLVFMSRSALLSAIERGITLGTDVTVASGTLGDAADAQRTTTSKDIYSFVMAQGVFAGLSLDGAVVSSRDKHNAAYYGPGATATAIALERRFDHPGAGELRAALQAR